MHFLELLTRAPTELEIIRYEYATILIGQCSGYVLGEAWASMPREVGDRFRFLARVDVGLVANSDNECTLYAPSELLEVWSEFTRLLALCRYEGHEPGLDIRSYLARWEIRSNSQSQEELRSKSNKICEFLQQGAEAGAWLLISH
jgi:hypothetical protein